jgi:uncharacterized protein YbbC (DUF1343 family)
MIKNITFFLLFLTIFYACKTTVTTSNNPIPKIDKNIKLGIDVLKQIDFALLDGKRVGLVTNPTGVDCELNSTIDILYNDKNVNLVALFGPEHGVRGDFSAGKNVKTHIDKKTNIPIYSLYGKNKKPNKKAMDMVDIIVYDIQDIGVRSYTFISTMGLILEAAADFDKEVLILDRPNPLGGNRVEGPLVTNGYNSFVSKYNIPYIYGLTIGELALLLNNEGLLKDGKKCNVQVVKMEGWKRDMTFNKTGLQWVPTSPHIPTWETAFYYASTGIIGELDPNLIGIGYTLPFQTLVTENIDASKLANSMNSLNLEGVKFRPIYFKPYYKNKKGVALQGVQIYITDFDKANLTEIQFLFLQEAKKIDPDFDIFKGRKDKFKIFDLVCGSDVYRKDLMKNYSYDSIKPLWNSDVEKFKTVSSNYHLYE